MKVSTPHVVQYHVADGDAGIAVNADIVRNILKYGQFMAAHGLVYNTFGNIAFRSSALQHDPYVIYTKRRGVSLEEMSEDDVVITDSTSYKLLFGKISPSNGHHMNAAMLAERSDIHAVIHSHPNSLIAYFASKDDIAEFPYISVDTPLVLGAPPIILSRKINFEADPSRIWEFVHHSNCFIMPNHGLITIGPTISEAYHRHLSCIAEIDRLIQAELLAAARQAKIRFTNEKDVNHMYAVGQNIIYGTKL